MAKFDKEATQAYQDTFGRKVEQVGHPAGKRKKSIRLYIAGGGSVIATQRKTPGHAELEANVLEALRAQGAPVPEVLAFDGKILFQEDLGKTRLSKALNAASPTQVENLLSSAITSLATTHTAAKSAGLKRNVMTLDGEEWRANLIAVPQKLARFLDLPVPDLPKEQLDKRLRVASPEFVKWDARPPNAILHKDGNISWIDWEHCGCRNRLDDLVWLFGDQSCPDFPDIEERLLAKYLPLFNDGMEPEDARDYLAAFGALHMCVRLGLSLNSNRKKGLKNWESVLIEDAGLLANAHRTAVRASRWASKSHLTKNLASWLSDVTHQIEEARQSHNDHLESKYNEDWESWVQTNIDNGNDENYIFQTLLDAKFDYHFIKQKIKLESSESAATTPSKIDKDIKTDSLPVQLGVTLNGSQSRNNTKKPSMKKTLTIGMATYDDYDGVYFTLQSLRFHHPEVQDRVEYLIIDNNPDSEQGKACKQIAELTGRDGNSPRCRYLPYDAVQGTAGSRNELFRQANTDFVMCVDCHVLFAPQSIKQFLDYIDLHPDTVDLLQGVLLHHDLEVPYTHFAPTSEDGTLNWKGGMLGAWAIDERGRDPNADPFEIPMHGLGVFAMKKDSWPSFNRHFKGFGGEEGYIHEKVRRLGGKTLCLPFLRWLHRFNRPLGVPYPNTYEDRFRNYVIGHRENELDETPIREHFATLMAKDHLEKVIDELADFNPLS